ncbi:7-alpha-hydroxycholest-4-en-3-one 12-alpha-hydroxylase [Colletotrichum tanaceti]|uniref:7-alpha-hydroxycholest-4-en-3-one 12-alpha-hydroxylase n=1 Tax=Colletotrichum tanaceti TaxID=1306861 RepID=A0A4U6XI69_9PEZI|nr:7-alpha-hydroxycholest-4-en-3-one 12-alpha-hydroxylase [Colletotrichum tanaceti]TKW53767.1 7-alpha-hydroxycholest-4-en-3-one 12-alpha-hydroxylase [Colletotrichum tanaceti]
MAGNNTQSMEANAASGSDSSTMTTGTLATAALVMIPLLLVLKKLLFPTFDPREPPVLRPRMPFFGHVVSLVRESGSFYARLYKESSMPICTLPMLHGKMYVANSPSLIAAAMRHADISFEPFQIEATSAVLGLPPHHKAKFLRPGVLHRVETTMASNLRLDPLRRMNFAALQHMAGNLNAIDAASALRLSDGFDWIKGVLSMATTTALYGKENMWDAENLEDLWTFEKGIGSLMLKVAPNLVAPQAIAARKRMNELLRPFYRARDDENPDVAKILQDRAAFFRELGMPSEDLPLIEFLIPFAAILNTAPNLYWTFAQVFSEPARVERIRREVLPLAAVTETADDDRGRVATIDARALEPAACPFLHACFREVLRLYSAQIGNRRIVEDATLEDADGRRYLLKKGAIMQWSASVTHFMPEVWGPDAALFRPERFLDVDPRQEKRRRGAMIPFGGGRHLCPGRYFAQTETLGFVSALALGYDVAGVTAPAAEYAPLGGATKRPVRGAAVDDISISRRKGWEDVTWEFVC